MQAPELILCNSYLQMGTEMHGDCRSTCLLSSAHCSGQRYLSSYKNDFPHITRNLWMRRLLYPACPKCFFLKVRQARSLRSCSCRGLQVQFCVGPLCFFWRLVSSNCSEDCPARDQEDKCTCSWTVVDLLWQLSGWLHQLPPNRHDTVANLQATPKPVLCSLLQGLKNLGLTAENAFRGLRLVRRAVLHCAVLPVWVPSRSCSGFHGNSLCAFIVSYLQPSLGLTFKETLIKTWHS